MFCQIRIYPIFKELLFHQVAAGWHLPSLAIKEMEGPMEVSNLFGISTFRSDISSPTPITEAIQLWLKLKSSKFWEPCPSEEQEFLNWTLIKWRKASSSRDETQFKRKIKFKTDSLYSTQLVVFWQCPYIYELIVPTHHLLLFWYHARSGRSIFLPRFWQNCLFGESTILRGWTRGWLCNGHFLETPLVLTVSRD